MKCIVIAHLFLLISSIGTCFAAETITYDAHFQNNNITNDYSLNLIKSCQEKYDQENSTFWSSVIRSQRGIYTQILQTASKDTAFNSFDTIESLPSFYQESLLTEAQSYNFINFEIKSIKFLTSMSLSKAIEAYLTYQINFSKSKTIKQFRTELLGQYPTFRHHLSEFDTAFSIASKKVLIKNNNFITSQTLVKNLKDYAIKINSFCEEIKPIVMRELGAGPNIEKSIASKLRISSRIHQQEYDSKLQPYIQTLTSQIIAHQKNLNSINSTIVSLLYTPSLRKIFPLNNKFFYHCTHPQLESAIQLNEINTSLIVDAKREFKHVISKELKNNEQAIEISENSNNIKKQMQTYLKYSPYLYGKYLKTLDTNDKNLLAQYICLKVNEIYSSDETWNISAMSGGIIIGTAVGLTTGFIGTGVGASLLAGGLVTTAEGVGIYYFDSSDANKIETAATMGAVSNDIGQDQFIALESLASDYYFSSYMAAGALVAAPIAHSSKAIFQASKQILPKKNPSHIGNIEKNISLKTKAKHPLPHVDYHEIFSEDALDRVHKVREFMRKNGYIKQDDDLNLLQKRAIIIAHKVGGENKGYINRICTTGEISCKPIHNYSKTELDDKIRALRGDQVAPLFPKEVREYIIREGIAGNKLSKVEKSKFLPKTEKIDSIATNDIQTKAAINRVDRFVESSLEELDKLQCFVKKHCKDFIIRITPALKVLIQKYENGPKIASKYINFIKKNNIHSLPEEQLTILKECLKQSKGELVCSPKQLELVLKLLERKWTNPPHPNFFKRIIRSIGKDPSQSKLERALRFIISEHDPSQQGKIIGKIDEVSIDSHDRAYINGILVTGENPLVKAVSIKREGEAIKLLAELGFEVTVLPSSESGRKLLGNGIQRNFERVSKLAKIDKGKNPDLILNGEFIADIYSPLRPLSLESTPRVIKRVLLKSEGNNYHTSYMVDNVEVFAKGERQTNRVVIYAKSYVDNINEIAEKIRFEIGEQNPSHLEEAFIIFKNEQDQAEILSVWP